MFDSFLWSNVLQTAGITFGYNPSMFIPIFNILLGASAIFFFWLLMQINLKAEAPHYHPPYQGRSYISTYLGVPGFCDIPYHIHNNYVHTHHSRSHSRHIHGHDESPKSIHGHEGSSKYFHGR